MCVDLGWLKTHFGFFVSGWDVVHARPFAILPISFYQEGFRELFYSADAARLYGRFYAGGYWQLELFAGRSTGDVEKIFENIPQDTRFDLEGTFSTFKVDYESVNSFFQSYLGIGYLETPASLQSLEDVGLAPEGANAEISWLQIGARCNYYRLYLMGKARWIKLDFTELIPRVLLIFLPQSFDRFSVVKPLMTYAALGYRISDHVEAYGYVGTFWFDKDDKAGSFASEGKGAPPYNYYLRNASVGLRWDIGNNLMFGIQWHRMQGTLGLTTVDNPVLSALPERWNMFNVIGSYYF